MSQLAFAFALPVRFGEGDFLLSPSNAAAHAALARWRDWPGGILLMTGPPGSGKSHLANIWADRTGASRLREGAPDAAWRTAAGGPSLIEDADRWSGRQEALFHVLNLVREHGASLLLTARAAPDFWGLGIPDLLSRLRQAPSVALGPPDEALLRAVLVKLFADRQIDIDSGLIDYMALRVDRSLGAVRTLVEALDSAALETGRRITRAGAAHILEAWRSVAE